MTHDEREIKNLKQFKKFVIWYRSLTKEKKEKYLIERWKGKRKMSRWEENARTVEQLYGSFVDWKERFYHCPDCGEPIYECDWYDEELKEVICPVCGFQEEGDEEE